MNNLCPVCNTFLKNFQENPQGRDGVFYSCPLCGDFLLSGTLVASLPTYLHNSKDASFKISYAIRSMADNNQVVELNTHTIAEIMKQSLPSPKEQADLLIRWLATKSEEPGQEFLLEPNTHRSIIGAKSDTGFKLILNHLLDSGMVSGKFVASGGAILSLSFEGWDYFENLRKGKAIYKKAFMAMKFGDPILENVLESVFKPYVEQAGFQLFKFDDNPRAGLIDDRMRVEIQSSDFVIADLSHDNLGAYWEAGYAEGLGKPVIFTCEKEKFNTTNTHFDTNHHLTIVWDKESPNEAGEKLKATIRATLPHLAIMSDS